MIFHAPSGSKIIKGSEEREKRAINDILILCMIRTEKVKPQAWDEIPFSCCSVIEIFDQNDRKLVERKMKKVQATRTFLI
jgi:hypothetical protein